MHLFIIPGNPPALHFYKLWAEEILREHKQSAIYLSPYRRLSNTSDSNAYLNETAKAHAENLLAFHKSVGKTVTVIGHSLGAWMALRLLEKHKTAIDKCLLLYPFLRRPDIKGRAILRLMRYLHPIPYIERLLLSSRAVLDLVFKELPYVTNEELCTSLTLARHEHTVISPSKKPLQIPKHLQDKLHMIYCDRDKWCPPDTIDEMKRSISTEKLEATHSFITSEQERKLVLKALLRFAR